MDIAKQVVRVALYRIKLAYRALRYGCEKVRVGPNGVVSNCTVENVTFLVEGENATIADCTFRNGWDRIVVM